MLQYTAQRLLFVVAVVWVMSVMIFGITHILPGNVAHAILGQYATDKQIAELEALLGLKDPLYIQYWRWFSGLLHGDFGRSLVMQRPAGPLILEALGRSSPSPRWFSSPRSASGSACTRRRTAAPGATAS
jgi:peptide/nickel transport system permease protein